MKPLVLYLILGIVFAGLSLPAPGATTAQSGSARYVLGPGDQISILALHAPEISDKPVRIDDSGNIALPLVGRMHAAGLTVEQLAAAIRDQLDPLIRDPQVSVNVVELRSRPVSVLGAVKTPGVYQLQGRKRLLEVISTAGGLDQDAGYSVRLSRMRSAGTIPLPASQITASGDYNVANIDLADLIEGKHPEQNIVILPEDVITVPRARLIYVIGEVHRPGGFALHDRESMSVLQALSLAEGLNTTAGANHAKILRPDEKTGRKTEIAVNVKNILEGKNPDVPLLPDDVLFIPNSASKSAAVRALQSAIEMGTGVVIWRH
jgi:polysaccharide biosynthesis/export protein